jgi:hypothetical protein
VVQVHTTHKSQAHHALTVTSPPPEQLPAAQNADAVAHKGPADWLHRCHRRLSCPQGTTPRFTIAFLEPTKKDQDHKSVFVQTHSNIRKPACASQDATPWAGIKASRGKTPARELGRGRPRP